LPIDFLLSAIKLENMSQLISVSEYLNPGQQLNVHLHSQTTSTHMLSFFNSILSNALVTDDNSEEASNDSLGLHADMNVNTHSKFSTEARPAQIAQQLTLSTLLLDKNVVDFSFYNALYQAPLASKNDPKAISREVIKNMPWLTRKKLFGFSEPLEKDENTDSLSDSLSENMLGMVEKSRALYTTI